MHNFTEEEQYFLECTSVEGRIFQALERIADRIVGCEPIVEVPHVGEVLAMQLVQIGLLVEGPADDPWQERGQPRGYKITDLGWEIKRRGKKPHNFSDN